MISKVATLRMIDILDKLGISANDHVNLYPKMTWAKIRYHDTHYNWYDINIECYDNGFIRVETPTENGKYYTIEEAVDRIVKCIAEAT